jgi:3-dehydroquinate synthetase
MITIEVNASRSYPIYIASGLIPQIGTYLKEISKDSKIAIISDSNVWSYYGDMVCASLNDAGVPHISDLRYGTKHQETVHKF